MFKEILSRLQIEKLNEMQEASIQASQKSKDILLLSPTGSGKTLAFLLPVLAQLNPELRGVQALILVPSRELAIQIESVFKKMSTGFKVSCCYGGHPTRVEKNNLEQEPALLIGTPGRIAYHTRHNNYNVETVRTLVLDEFDKSLEFGFEKDMSFIIYQLSNVNKRILTSATDMGEIPAFTGVEDAFEINYLTTKENKPQLTLKAVRAFENDKLDALFGLICMLGGSTSLVFCNHREAVDRIGELLKKNGIVHDIFHGGMDQEDRERALIKFRNGSHRILLTTDLASRGLDIPEIENVIHYQLPLTEDAYIHRNGRTARMKAEGNAWLVLAEEEQLPAFIKTKPEFDKLPATPMMPPASEYVTIYLSAGKKDKVNKVDIVGFLLQKGKLQKEELGLIEVLDFTAYAAVKRNKVEDVLYHISKEKLKNKKVKIEISR